VPYGCFHSTGRWAWRCSVSFDSTPDDELRPLEKAVEVSDAASIPDPELVLDLQRAIEADDARDPQMLLRVEPAPERVDRERRRGVRRVRGALPGLGGL
jgi:hypothetical protein